MCGLVELNVRPSVNGNRTRTRRNKEMLRHKELGPLLFKSEKKGGTILGPKV